MTTKSSPAREIWHGRYYHLLNQFEKFLENAKLCRLIGAAPCGILKPVSKRHLLPVTQVMSCRCLCRPTCAHSSREPATPRPRLPFRSIFASFLPSAQAFLVLTQLKLLFFFFFVVGFQLWDVRDGMCRQTFSGHESDINAIGVSTLIFHGLKLTRLKTDWCCSFSRMAMLLPLDRTTPHVACLTSGLIKN